MPEASDRFEKHVALRNDQVLSLLDADQDTRGLCAVRRGPPGVADGLLQSLPCESVQQQSTATPPGSGDVQRRFTHSLRSSPRVSVRGHHFASRGLRVRVPLAPPLVNGMFPAVQRISYEDVQQQTAASQATFRPPNPGVSQVSTGPHGYWPTPLESRYPSSPRSDCAEESASPPADGDAPLSGQAPDRRR